MKQKLGLACALLGQPKVLLLDEPGVGVDPISRRELWRMVRELTGGGLSVVWSTSYLDEAALCDEVLLLNEGKVLYSGVPGDLTSRLAGGVASSGAAGMGGAGRRQMLVKALRVPGVLDGCIQGRSVRLVLREAQGEKPRPWDWDWGMASNGSPRRRDSRTRSLICWEARMGASPSWPRT